MNMKKYIFSFVVIFFILNVPVNSKNYSDVIIDKTFNFFEKYNKKRIHGKYEDLLAGHLYRLSGYFKESTEIYEDLLFNKRLEKEAKGVLKFYLFNNYKKQYEISKIDNDFHKSMFYFSSYLDLGVKQYNDMIENFRLFNQ